MMKQLSQRFVTFILGCLLFSACSSRDESSSAPYTPNPIPVLAAAAQERNVSLRFEALGTIKASQVVEVQAQVVGIITGVHFTEGDYVNEGDLLYTIDPVPYTIKVQELEAALSQNIAHLQNAKKKLDRYKSLAKQDLIAPVERDDLETKVLLYEAQCKADEARLAGAKLDLAHCRILAPIGGKTGKAALQVGNMVGQAPLVSISQNNALCVDFSLTEKELQQLGSLDPVIEVYAAGSEEKVASGQVSFIDHSVDANTGMIAIRGYLPTLYRNLWPGQSVRVEVIFKVQEAAILIPAKAIKTNQNGAYVFFIKEDNTVESRQVKLGLEEKGFVVIEEGIFLGEKVVTDGHTRLYLGALVKETEVVQ